MKYNLLFKTFSVFFILLFFSPKMNAQQQNIDVTAGEKTVIFEDQFVKIEGTITGCDNHTSGINNTYVMLTFTNLTQNTRNF